LDAAARELGEETGLCADRWSVLVDVALSPGFTDEAVRVFLAEGLHDVDREDPEHEEADLQIARVPLAEAVDMALRGDLVNATAVSGILALAAASSAGTALRPADAPWPDRPTAFGERKSRV
jgi:ADP-ribose pyrophosphatase